MGNVVTRFSGGIGTVADNNILADLPFPDPTKYHVFFDDFDGWVAAADGAVNQWTVTAASTGTAAASNIDGGNLLLTAANTDEDLIQVQRTATTFLPAAGKKLFFKARFKVLTTAATDFLIGLSVTDTSLISASAIGTTEGIAFFKAAAATSMTFYNRLDGSTGSTSATITGPLADDTYATVGFFYDGVSKVSYMFNDVILGSVSGSSTYLPNTILTPSIALAAEGTGGAQTAHVDYIFVAQER